MAISFHSNVAIEAMRRANVERGLKRSRLLTSGPFEGWRCYGPYIHQRQGRLPTEFFRLRKAGHKTINIPSEQIDLERMTEVREEKKPFIDWIKW